MAEISYPWCFVKVFFKMFPGDDWQMWRGVNGSSFKTFAPRLGEEVIFPATEPGVVEYGR